MKRTLTTTLMALLLCVCMVFGLTACGGFTQDDIDNAVNEATAPLNSQITALEADIADKAAKITTLETEKAALTTEKTELLEDIEEIEAEVTALETEKATLEAEVAALENEKASLTTDKATLEASITAKNNEIATLNSSIDALNTEKASLTARVGELEASITAKDTEISSLNSSIATLKAEKQALTDKVAKLEKENAELKECLAGNHAFEVSYEWADDYSDCTATQVCQRTHCDLENELTATSITVSGATLTAAFDGIANAEIDVSTIENKDYIVATDENNNTTYVTYTESGLLAWNTYAQTNTETNLVLGNDITLPLAEGETSNWTSVGTETTPYTGTVDGNGYSITGLTINQTVDNAGFIGYLNGGTIKNLTMKGLSVSNTGNNTGGLVGYKTGGTIEFCRVESGTVNGTTNVGGLVGLQYKGYIIACSNAANVNGSGNLGGIAGTLSSTVGGYAIGCYNTGAIEILTDNWDSGGIGGHSLYGTIKGCYNTDSSGNYAIVGLNRNVSTYYSSSNYWSSSHSAAYGRGTEGVSANDGCTKIENTSTAWEAAATAMNTELEGYGYRYVVNTDSATNSTEPLIIEKITE